MKKKLAIFISVVLILLILSFCAVNSSGLDFSVGRAYQAVNGSTLIVTENGSPIVMKNLRGNEKMFSSLDTGDKIFIIHDGVEETYPARTGVWLCIKTSDGQAKDIPEKVKESLEELGWKTE